MKSKIWFFILCLAFKLQAEASASFCSQVFNSKFISIQILSRSLDRVSKAWTTAPSSLSASRELEDLAKEHVQKAQEYLILEGLTFQLQKQILRDFEYFSFQIGSGPNIFQLASSYSKALPKLNFIYDPLLTLRKAGAGAYYDPKSNTLYFSSSSLIFKELGLADHIRHELGHAIEQKKLMQNQLTLAQFHARKSHPRKNLNLYEDFLSLDELETYLRDLRYYKYASSKIKLEIPENRMEKVTSQKIHLYQFSKDTLSFLIPRSRLILSKIVQLTKTHEPIFFEENGIKSLHWVNVPDFPFDHITYQYTGAHDDLSLTLTWAKKRIDEIEAEFNSFKGNPIP
jgi:hypothetical protein